MKQANEEKSGFLLVNKPSGPTSHDMVDKLRRITSIRKIGHAGTLDPFASGLLIMAVGREATRKISEFVKMEKKYEAVLRLGKVSDTYDRTGKIVNFQFSIPNFQFLRIEEILKSFIGKQKQTPPMYSAKKIGGKKLYELARAGKEVERARADIEIYDVKILKYNWPSLEMKVGCSSGTYIRSLAHDIGEKLGCGAYLEELRRTAIGRYKIENALNWKEMNKDNWEEFLF